ncbi:MAG TPA: Hsp20/alpha crystallin family protein [Methyloceanibacter sp.]|jgi:HSP20 family molecular chaperone IbpA|nr:Hsp20/alpha crystallin family protein [Methyloceanibacter sp.]
MAEDGSLEAQDRTGKPYPEKLNAAHQTVVRRMLATPPQPKKAKEANVADQALQVQEKKELVPKGEKTVPARYFVPATDIYEGDDGLTVVMEMPGVDRKDVEVRLENDELHVEAQLDLSKYEGMEPLYTEYNVGHFSRAFSLSQKIDQRQITASLDDGVLTLTLKKVQEAMPRRIEIK